MVLALNIFFNTLLPRSRVRQWIIPIGLGLKVPKLHLFIKSCLTLCTETRERSQTWYSRMLFFVYYYVFIRFIFMLYAHTGKHVCYAKDLWRTTALLTPAFGVFILQNFGKIALVKFWRNRKVLNFRSPKLFFGHKNIIMWTIGQKSMLLYRFHLKTIQDQTICGTWKRYPKIWHIFVRPKELREAGYRAE